MTLVHLLNGGAFDTANPGACRSITLDVIASSLAKQCRFNGHTHGFYSVAQHSVIVARNVPFQDRRHALLHDAHETITGDIVRPIKAELWNDGLQRLVDSVDEIIYQTLGIDPPDDLTNARIKEADDRALATEKRDLLWPCDWWSVNAEPFDRHIRPKAWESARSTWLKTWEECEIVIS